jgi:hypothetical protein
MFGSEHEAEKLKLLIYILATLNQRDRSLRMQEVV